MQETHHAPGEAHSGLRPRQYLLIGAALTIITLVELWVSYSNLGDLIIPVLLILSAVKFAAVVAFFMHLRYDSDLFTKIFVGSFLLAAAILIALLGLFWNEAHGARLLDAMA